MPQPFASLRGHESHRLLAVYDELRRAAPTNLWKNDSRYVDLFASARRLFRNPLPPAGSSVGRHVLARGELGNPSRPAALHGVHAARRDRTAPVAALSDARPDRRRRGRGGEPAVLYAVSFRIAERAEPKRIFDAGRQRLRNDGVVVVSEE